jgi:hypothetical protein
MDASGSNGGGAGRRADDSLPTMTVQMLASLAAAFGLGGIATNLVSGAPE